MTELPEVELTGASTSPSDPPPSTSTDGPTNSDPSNSSTPTDGPTTPEGSEMTTSELSSCGAPDMPPCVVTVEPVQLEVLLVFIAVLAFLLAAILAAQLRRP